MDKKRGRNRRQAYTEAGKTARKSLGQNYIFDRDLLESLAEATGIPEDADILEIGTGMGTLTEALSRRFRSVRTVEIDRDLIPVLRVSLEKYGNVDLVEGDVLRLDLKELMKDRSPFHVVANIPYYLTTELIQRLIMSRLPMISASLMVQKEAARRICARPGEEGYCLLSLQCAYYAETEILAEVDRRKFDPVPNVDSAFVRLRMREKTRYRDCPEMEKRWLRIASAAFAMRRKTFVNNAVPAFGMSRDEAVRWLEECSIGTDRRGETFTLEETYRLTEDEKAFER